MPFLSLLCVSAPFQKNRAPAISRTPRPCWNRRYYGSMPPAEDVPGSGRVFGSRVFHGNGVATTPGSAVLSSGWVTSHPRVPRAPFGANVRIADQLNGTSTGQFPVTLFFGLSVRVGKSAFRPRWRSNAKGFTCTVALFEGIIAPRGVPMTSEKQAEIMEVMANKYISVKGHRCACGAIAGRLSDRVATVALENEAGAPRTALRCVMVTCGICGTVTLYDPAVWGVQL